MLVNNAGIYEAVADNAADDEWHAAWQRTLTINLQAAADLCRLAVSHFLDRGGGGRIVNVASRAAYRGDSPAALALCRVQGGDGRHDQDHRARLCGARASSASRSRPGFTVSEMTEEYLQGRGGAQILADIPLGRVATHRRGRRSDPLAGDRCARRRRPAA